MFQHSNKKYLILGLKTKARSLLASMYLHHTGKCTSTHLCSHMVWGRGENKAGSQDYAATKHRLANPRKLSESMEENRGDPRLLSIGWL